MGGASNLSLIVVLHISNGLTFLCSSRFGYYGPQIKFCGWAYEMNFCIWNFMPISKNCKKRRSVIEVQITK